MCICLMEFEWPHSCKMHLSDIDLDARSMADLSSGNSTNQNGCWRQISSVGITYLMNKTTNLFVVINRIFDGNVEFLRNGLDLLLIV